MSDENELHVEVNETNIAIYDLVRLTGNTKEVMLQAAKDAEQEGYVLTCKIPSPEDNKIEVNAFEHFQSEPAPKLSPVAEHMSDPELSPVAEHMSDPELGPLAKALSSGQTPGTAGVRCRYEIRHTDEVGDVWVCIIHGNNSKHDVTGPDSDVPCLTIDPYHTERP